MLKSQYKHKHKIHEKLGYMTNPKDQALVNSKILKWGYF